MERMHIPKTPEMQPLRDTAAKAKRQVHGVLQEQRTARHDAEERVVNAEKKSVIDPLTETMNRRGYEQRIHALQEGVRRGTQTPFSMIAFDIDRFKSINDTYGHATGDKVLKEFVKNIQGAIRENDFLARCGGEEFRLVVQADLKDAADIAERLRKIIERVIIDENIKDAKGDPFHFQVSAGVSPYNGDTKTMEIQSDDALYAAKGKDRPDNESKRNQVWMWTSDSRGRGILEKYEPTTIEAEELELVGASA